MLTPEPQAQLSPALETQTGQDPSLSPSVPPWARDISGSLADEGQCQKYTSYARHLPHPCPSLHLPELPREPRDLPGPSPPPRAPRALPPP